MNEFVAGLDGDNLVYLLAILALATAAGLYWCVVGLRHARLIGDTPTARVRSAPQGYVELIGTARTMPGPPIVSPLTARRCVHWFYRIQRLEGAGRNRTWRTIEKGRSDDLFHLEDETGSCVVDPEGAKVVFGETNTWHGGSRRPERGPRGGSSFALIGRRYRYHEALIRVGDPLYALGEFTTQRHDGRGDEQTQRRNLLAQWKRDPQRMALLDVDGDGQVDLKEWAAARRAATAQVRRELAEAQTAPAVNLLHRGTGGRPYLLAAVSEEKLLRTKWLKGYGGFGLFLVCGTLLVWIAQARGLL